MDAVPPSLNVCFHGIGVPSRTLESGEAPYWISVDEFARILDELATWPKVNISFDDGNESDVQFGLEALLQRDLKATFFVLAGRFGSPGSLDVDHVRELRRCGMTIGTHGMDHRPWRGMDPTTRERELVEARARISDVVGAHVDLAALPLGQYDRSLLSQLRKLGYATVFTSDRRVARAGAWLQPRFSVREADTAAGFRHEILADVPFRRWLELSARGFAKRHR